MSIDLHCHTMFSIDSFGTPEELIDTAAEKHVVALAITDHNSLDGVERGAIRAKQRGIIFIPGIELDAYYGEKSYHFLGLGVDWRCHALHELATRNFQVYKYRFEIYLRELLQKGFPWSREELKEHLPARYPTHPLPILSERVVRHLVEYRGGLDGFSEMHEKASNEARRELENSRHKISFCKYHEAREAVHQAGGVLLLAHPGKYYPGDIQAQMRLTEQLLSEGTDGVEVYHWANFKEAEAGRELIGFAEHKGCLISGGSDCGHAKNPSEQFLGRSRFEEPPVPETLIRQFEQQGICFD